MSAKPQFVKQEDPAGLDKLLLAAGKGIARYFEFAIGAKIGRPISIWDGPDGLGAILQEHIEAAGVPNKRLPELITPRAVLANAFQAPRKRRRIFKVGPRKVVR